MPSLSPADACLMAQQIAHEESISASLESGFEHAKKAGAAIDKAYAEKWRKLTGQEPESSQIEAIKKIFSILGGGKAAEVIGFLSDNWGMFCQQVTQDTDTYLHSGVISPSVVLQHIDLAEGFGVMSKKAKASSALKNIHLNQLRKSLKKGSFRYA